MSATERPPRFERRVIRGWGRTSSAIMPVAVPGSIDDLQSMVAEMAGGHWLAVGAGRSYGDQGLSDTSTALTSEQLTDVESFDQDTGELVVQSGKTFAAVLKEFLPRQYMLPVSPGTSFATLGGAAANDVHGKNHDRDGSFGSHINWVDIVTPGGELQRASPETNSRLFNATIGGAGMTGVIARMSVNLMRVPGNSVAVQESRMRNLDEFLERLDEARSMHQFSVGWIDALQRGREFGRGILECAALSDEHIPVRDRLQLTVPIDFPSWSLNRFSVRSFNALYFRRVPSAGRKMILPIDRFLYPLDAIRHWNRIYGRRGFYQFQCVVPEESGATAIRALLREIADSGAGSFLAVLKTLGASGHGYLSFPMAGYTLALDFPRSKKTYALLQSLARQTVGFGGRIYLAKDATVDARTFRRMYPQFEEFRKTLQAVDPTGVIHSEMSARLGFRD